MVAKEVPTLPRTLEILRSERLADAIICFLPIALRFGGPSLALAFIVKAFQEGLHRVVVLQEVRFLAKLELLRDWNEENVEIAQRLLDEFAENLAPHGQFKCE